MTLENSIYEGLVESSKSSPLLNKLLDRNYSNIPQVIDLTGRRIGDYDLNNLDNKYFSLRNIKGIEKLFSYKLEVPRGYVAPLLHAAATPKNNVDAGVVECVKGPYVTNAGSAYSSSE